MFHIQNFWKIISSRSLIEEDGCFLIIIMRIFLFSIYQNNFIDI
jgi:hypothetical protein